MRSGLKIIGNLRMAASARLGNVDLVGGALRVFMAQNVMRSMAALAICRYQQPLLTERKPVDGVHIQRINIGQAVLLCHRLVAVAHAACARNIQGVDRRPGIGLGEDGVRVSMATGAGMFRLVRMDAPCKPRSLFGVAGLALDRRHLLRVGIFLDAGVAIVALQAAVNAGSELLPIHADTMPRRILHPWVRMTRQAIRSRLPNGWSP